MTHNTIHVHALLDRLLEYAEQTHPHIRSLLQPGLDATTIRQRVPLDLPEDVVALYQWHNGVYDEDQMEEQELFYYHHFLSLEDALRVYFELRRIDDEIRRRSTNNLSCAYLPQLFPLFSFQGEYYAVWTDSADDDFGSIYFVHQGAAKVYNHLTSMLTAILECYNAGAYMIQDGNVVLDEQRVAAIKAAWNTCRVFEDGTTLKDHP